MSLIRWRELAKRKTMVGDKISFVYDTLTKAKLGEETSQLAYEKIFRPITSKMDVSTSDGTSISSTKPTSIVKKKPSCTKEIDYYPDVDPYEEMDVEGLIDFGEEVLPGEEKQPPVSEYEDSPPAYSPGQYMKLKQQRALEEKEVYEKYGLPIIETTEETSEKALEAYDRVVKELGNEKRKLTNLMNKLEDPSEKENLKKQREQLQRESLLIIARRDKLKKTGKGFGRKRGGNLIFFNNPKELVKKLDLIIGEISAGNTNIDMRNTRVAILDELLKSSLIDKTVHKRIYRKYFKKKISYYY